jgi:AraC-like DNA-binding protein
VCDTKALPKRYLGVHIAKGNRKGMAVEFPSDWLLKPIDLSRFNNPKLMAKTGLDQLPDFISALKSIVDLHLDNPELNVDYVAQLFGTSRQSLQRLARSNGTTLVDEIKSLKIDRACNGLIATRKPIKEVAASVGFNSVASFSRAFKSWTNLSPQAYRRLNQAVI